MQKKYQSKKKEKIYFILIIGIDIFFFLKQSRRASRRWGKLSEIEKRPWHGLAEQEKLAHREAFPEYRYCPRRATSSSVSPPSPTQPNNPNRARSATTSDMNTPLMHNVFSIPSSLHRPTKRVKRNSK